MTLPPDPTRADRSPAPGRRDGDDERPTDGPALRGSGDAAGERTTLGSAPRGSIDVVSGSTVARVGADRCPGALAPFSAEDGLIVRARVPGGEVALDALEALLAIGEDYGSPRVQLTSRGNLQVRGLPDPLPADVAERMADAGLLPSLTHEKARNILAAPTSPRLRALARDLDRRLCARPSLAGLPGRFLFLLTDRTGLGLDERYDIAYVDAGSLVDPLGDGPNDELSGDPEHGLLIMAGLTLRCSRAEAPDAMLDLAERFLQLRTDDRTWNIRDLPAGSPFFTGIRDRSPAEGGLPRSSSEGRVPRSSSEGGLRRSSSEGAVPRSSSEGAVPRSSSEGALPRSSSEGAPATDVETPQRVLRTGPHGRELVVGVPLGLLERVHLDALRGITDRVVVTPWRSLLIDGGAGYADHLARVGLVTTDRSTWSRITACTGAPYCARGRSETMNLARDCAAELPVEGPRLHLVGCERRCGAPRSNAITIVGARSVADVTAAQ
ncbi:cobalamin biosynthesis protein CobG [Cumulibacter manganitolerans]|uniref:cobalamin biosynthesis protein CobG n=1 Tax=Cumulibacter manganitolerans TaxID=1884992 RepID=UPI001295D415|nr:cobalamin biosynthesis protein CobG [Cumulibacter manganitolerans]